MKYLILSSLLFVAHLLAAQSFKPVNTNASHEAQKLLAYLYEIDDEHTLAGQHNYNHEMNRYTMKAQDIGGRYPAIWGTDFSGNGAPDPGQKIVDEAIEKHKAGVIVTLMWHAGRPMDDPPFRWSESIQGELTVEEWKELTTPGTPLHARWRHQADQIAFYLTQLRDASVPVLWRPYHEMNGVWFWWGDKKGEDGYAKLWKMLFDRFVNYHQLNNLVWVWNANAPRDIPGDEAYAYKDYYPGHEYVDVLATDVYNFDYEQKDYEELLAVAEGRVIALGEVGELPKLEILAAQPKWAWFMVWASWLETHNTLERVMTIYNLRETLTLEEINLHK
ncbi:MAG: glycosyl hydrolase [Cyclobacteriaceae bacterium]